MSDSLLVIMALLGVGLLLFILSGIRYIPNNRIGIVEKRFSLTKGSVRSGFIALNGEAGYQPRVLRGGSWLDTPWHCRSTRRTWNVPNDRTNVVGFRVVRVRTVR